MFVPNDLPVSIDVIFCIDPPRSTPSQRMNFDQDPIAGLHAGPRPSQPSETAGTRRLKQPIGRLVTSVEHAVDREAHMRIDPAHVLDGAVDRQDFRIIVHRSRMVSRARTDAGEKAEDGGNRAGGFETALHWGSGCLIVVAWMAGLAPQSGATRLPPGWRGIGTNTASPFSFTRSE
jgi:hypothetical protein